MKSIGLMVNEASTSGMDVYSSTQKWDGMLHADVSKANFYLLLFIFIVKSMQVFTYPGY